MNDRRQELIRARNIWSGVALVISVIVGLSCAVDIRVYHRPAVTAIGDSVCCIILGFCCGAIASINDDIREMDE